MIYGQWALALNLFTVGVLAFIVAKVFVSISFWFIKSKFQHYTVSTRKSLLWLCVLAPWLIALCVMLFFSPLFQNGSVFVWLTEFAHWHHPDIFYFVSWHSASLLIFIAFTLFILIKKATLLYRNHNQINLLRELGTEKSKHVYVIESSIPTAFTGGIFKPLCFISTGLIEQTSANEIEIITQHELAHVHHLDPLKKWLFLFFTAFFTKNVKQVLRSMMSLSMEQAADSFYAENQQQSHNVASTLVKFTKLAASYSIHPQYNSELFVHFCRHSIEQRVLHLLSDKQFRPFPTGGVVIAIPLLVLISTTSVDSLHHVIETLFTH